jgi:hypothetical protein
VNADDVGAADVGAGAIGAGVVGIEDDDELVIAEYGPMPLPPQADSDSVTALALSPMSTHERIPFMIPPFAITDREVSGLPLRKCCRWSPAFKSKGQSPHRCARDRGFTLGATGCAVRF